MIDVHSRINAILSRMTAINNRFNKQRDSSVGFKENLAVIQEKIYEDRSAGRIITKYNNIIEKKAEKYSLPAKLIKSMIKQESNFNPRAVSSKGAKGLMQLMPETAGLLGVKNVFNPEENIDAGVKYLKMMSNRFDGNLEKALAAYNAGPEAVKKYNGVPDYKETKDYIKNVIKNMRFF